MLNDPLAPIRRELQEFLPSQRLIKAFEALFSLVPSSIVVNDLDSGNAISIGNECLAAIASMNSILRYIESAPEYTIPQVIGVDAVNFNLNPVVAPVVGQSKYDKTNDSLQITHLSSVKELVGLVSYARCNNGTGSTINPFKCVYSTGVTDVGYPDIALFQADGGDPVTSVVGLTAQSITNGSEGRVVSFGLLQGVDTSSFSIGDILYADPSTPGDLTTTKPTAPNVAVQIGMVVKDDASDGWIFVNPITVPQPSYGAFSRTTDTSPALINTAYPIEFANTQISSGIVIGVTPSQFIFSNKGLYDVTINFQLYSSSTALKNVWFWIRKNGSDVSNSATLVSIETNSQYISVSQEHTVSVVPTDYIEVMWAADSTAVTLDAVASTAFSPAAPSCKVMINQVQQ